MTIVERICDVALIAIDRLHIFRRQTLDEWRAVAREAEDGAARVRAQIAADIEQMPPDERCRLPNRFERVYLGLDGGQHD